MRPAATRQRLTMPTIIRIDPCGHYWLMHTPTQGWGSTGVQYPSLDAVCTAWDIEIGTAEYDQHSPYLPCWNRPEPPCTWCGGNGVKSGMQPAFCADCVQAMLRGAGDSRRGRHQVTEDGEEQMA